MVLEGLSLTYYKDNKRAFCVGSLDVRDIQTARQTDRKQSRELEINTKSTLYSFTAETDELAEAWVIAIQQSMLQKSTVRSSNRSDMSSSDYAQIGDVVPEREKDARSRIYEEIAELQGSQEKNIFGVKLRSSRFRPRPPTIPEQPNDDPETQRKIPPFSSFKPVLKSPITRPAVNNAVEPIYAKPDKHLVKPSSIRKVSKKFNKPPPSFAPPPPPGCVIDRPDRPAVKTPKPQHVAPSSDIPETIKDEAKVQDKLAESEYAKIGDVNSKALKKEYVDPNPGESSNGEHVYYMADAILSPKQEEKNVSEHTSGEDIPSLKEASDATFLRTSESQASAHTAAESTPTTDSNPSDDKPPVKEASDAPILRTSESQTSTSTATESTPTTDNSYEAVDLSQVVRRKRGSHVTTSFSEESISSNDSTELVPLRGRHSSTNRRGTLSNQVNVDIVEETNENIESSKSTEDTYMNTTVQSAETNEDNEVFLNKPEEDDKSAQEMFEQSSYGMTLESVIGSIGKYVEDTSTVREHIDDGEAFVNLKTYFERNSHGGFDLELHRVSCRNSVERLSGLLM